MTPWTFAFSAVFFVGSVFTVAVAVTSIRSQDTSAIAATLKQVRVDARREIAAVTAVTCCRLGGSGITVQLVD
jgi:hypothetical protein